MKILHSMLTALAVLATGLRAQEVEVPGFLNILNLIPAKIPAEVHIADKELLPGGMKPGDSTGWFMVPPGEKAMSIRLNQPDDEIKPPIPKANGTIDVISGQGNLVALILEPSKQMRSDGSPFPPRIRIRKFPTYDTRGYGLRFVSVCTTEHRFKIGPLEIDARPFEPVDIPKWTGLGFPIMHHGKVIGKTAGSSEPDSFYLFVGENGEGGFLTSMIRAGNQQAPPWLQHQKIKTAPEP
jgi:hypothetical protein